MLTQASEKITKTLGASELRSRLEQHLATISDDRNMAMVAKGQIASKTECRDLIRRQVDVTP